MNCALFICLHVPKPFSEPFSEYDFSCLAVSRVNSLPASTQTQYQARHKSQPFAVDCIRGINCYFGVRAKQFT